MAQAVESTSQNASVPSLVAGSYEHFKKSHTKTFWTLMLKNSFENGEHIVIWWCMYHFWNQ